MRHFRFQERTRAAVPAFTLALLAAGVLTTSRAAVQTAGTLFVNVDATALPEGPLNSIPNSGTLGGVFAATGGADATPKVATVGGTKGIQFDGSDYLQNMTAADGGTPIFAPAGLVGTDPTQSIEVWALNPALDGEETLVSWGHRGGNPDGSNMSFNYGSDFRWGAVGHWGNPDLGWNNQGGGPAAGHWHHLVYTYDGTTTRVYADGQFQNGEYVGPGAINTFPDTTILIGAQTEPDATTVTAGLRFSGTIARVRVHDGVLTPEQIANNYNTEKAAFIDPVPTPPPVITPELATKAPVHRYSFNEAAGDATAKEFKDSAATAHGQVLGEGATFSGSRLILPGGPSATAAYGDLPNGLLSSNAVANAGSGQFTFETWARFTGSHAWSRVFDFGSSSAGDDTGEVLAPGGTGNGLDYFMLSAQIGGDVNTRRFEIRDNEDSASPSQLADVPTQTFGTDTHLVATWDEASGKVELYENGVRVGGFTDDNKMSDITDVNVWLGRSNYMGDENTQVEFDEVRLYDTVLTPGQVLGDFQAGPNNLNSASIPVTLASDPQSVSVPETGTANFSVTGGGSFPVALQWLRNGTPIPGATNPVYRISNVTAADNGAVFTARLSNTVSGSAVQVTSKPATLTVLTPSVTLKNRYSFNETSGTTVIDSVGAKNGTANGNATLGGGQLTLDGSEGTYVDLPAGIITALGADGTIELWFTHQTPAIWSRIFDFGNSALNDAGVQVGVDYLFLTARDGDGFPRFVANFPDAGDLTTLDPAPPGWIPGNQETHVAITWSSTGNTARMFINGVLVASGPASKALSAMNNQDVQNWLGRSQFAPDSYWAGKYNEVRLYSGAMTPSQVQASLAAGPNGNSSSGNPSLKAAVNGNNLVISWAASATGYVLESSPTLGAGATWTAVTGVTTAGDQQQASVPLTGRGQFYRLKKA